MNFGLIHSVWMLLLMAVFIAIVFWAWSGRRKKAFDEAARLALEEEEPATGSGDKHDG